MTLMTYGLFTSFIAVIPDELLQGSDIITSYKHHNFSSITLIPQMDFIHNRHVRIREIIGPERIK